jgi:hypothetical protein
MHLLMRLYDGPILHFITNSTSLNQYLLCTIVIQVIYNIIALPIILNKATMNNTEFQTSRALSSLFMVRATKLFRSGTVKGYF